MPAIVARVPLGVVADVAVAAVLTAVNLATSDRRAAVAPVLVAETVPAAVRTRWPLAGLAAMAALVLLGRSRAGRLWQRLGPRALPRRRA